MKHSHFTRLIFFMIGVIIFPFLSPIVSLAADNLKVNYKYYEGTITGSVYTDTSDPSNVTFNVLDEKGDKVYPELSVNNVETVTDSVYKMSFSADHVFHDPITEYPEHPITVSVTDSEGTVTEEVYGAGTVSYEVYSNDGQPIDGSKVLFFEDGAINSTNYPTNPAKIQSIQNKLIELDSFSTTESTENSVSISAGEYDVVVHAFGYQDKLMDVTVNPNQTTKLNNITLQPKSDVMPSAINAVYDENGNEIADLNISYENSYGTGDIIIKKDGSKELGSEYQGKTLTLKVDVGGEIPHLIRGKGNIQDWHVSDKGILTIKVKPVKYSFFGDSVKYEAAVTLGVEYYYPLLDDITLRNSYFSTNYTLLPPKLYKEKIIFGVSSLTESTDPFFKAYIPSSQLDAWEITSLSELGFGIGSDSSDSSDVQGTVYGDVEQGAVINLDINSTISSITLGNKSNINNAGSLSIISEPVEEDTETSTDDSSNNNQGNQHDNTTTDSDPNSNTETHNDENEPDTDIAPDENKNTKDGTVTPETIINKKGTGAGHSEFTVELQVNKVEQALENEEQLEKVIVNVPDVSVGDTAEITFSSEVMDIIKEESKTSVVEISTNNIKYRLPAEAIDTQQVVDSLGVSQEDVKFTIEMHETTGTVEINNNDIKQAANVYAFEIFASSDDQSIEVDQFNTYVQRQIEAEQAFDPSRSIAVRINQDGTYTPVPTIFDGNQAILFSRSNSKYTIIESENVELSDIDGLWIEDEVKKLAAKHIIKGKTDGTFAPNEATTRAHMVALLSRALGLSPVQSYDERFTDVNGDEWFAPQLMAVAKAGIVEGKQDGTFAPNEILTRQQAAAMIGRAIDFTGYDSKKLNQNVTLSKYQDKNKIGEWAKSEVKALLQAGIMTGKPNHTFDPKAKLTRAQAAKIINESLKFIGFMD